METMSVGELAASQLGLPHYEEETPRETPIGLPILNLKNEHDSYEVYVIEETEEAESLHQAATMAGFYNSRFFHEYVQMNKADVKVGEYRSAFRIEDSERNLSLFAVTRRDGFVLAELSTEHLANVAEQLAKLHAISVFDPNLEFCQTVMENYQVISEYRAEVLRSTLNEARQLFQGEHKHFFQKPDWISGELEQHSQWLSDRSTEDETGLGALVLCHGNLTAESLRFTQDGEHLVSIVDWENVHFGDPAFDLSHLIITSASPEIRRNHFMKVFRTYFYTLIDIRAQKFKLSDLKTSFRRFHREILLNGLRPLLDLLSSDVDDALKRSSAARWEDCAEETASFLSGQYISDEEQCFFAK
ncbi:unnamed protein product, partial [Mesorhabditis belari]|uniref:CHK kinase-like domain-containing protein n=1 Tax=Mesorhabditis belari TaxID=2138241 RepID=A0AAF3F1P8_9BILA